MYGINFKELQSFLNFSEKHHSHFDHRFQFHFQLQQLRWRCLIDYRTMPAILSFCPHQVVSVEDLERKHLISRQQNMRH